MTKTNDTTAQLIKLLSNGRSDIGACVADDEQEQPNPELQEQLTHQKEYDLKHVLNLSLADTDTLKHQK